MLYFLMHYAQSMYTANDRKLAGHFFTVKNNTKHSAYSIYCDFINHTCPFYCQMNGVCVLQTLNH